MENEIQMHIHRRPRRLVRDSTRGLQQRERPTAKEREVHNKARPSTQDTEEGGQLRLNSPDSFSPNPVPPLWSLSGCHSDYKVR